MSSSVSEVGEKSEDGDRVVLVNLRVLSADDSGKTNQGVDGELAESNESSALESTQRQQTDEIEKCAPSTQVNILYSLFTNKVAQAYNT